MPPAKEQFQSRVAATEVTIPNGASVPTAGIDLHGTQMVAVITPAAWSAAALSWLVSHDDVTYVPLYDDAGTEVTIPSGSMATAEARGFALDPVHFAGWRYVKPRSGTRATPVNQAADRELVLITRPVG